MKLNCLIVDDEPIARKVLEEYVGDVEFLSLAGSVSDSLKAETFLHGKGIDLIFLDIQMPKMNGIDFLKNTKWHPMVIVTTAFPEHALTGYELNVTDYLVKPVAFQRFFKACCKAREMHSLKNGLTGYRNGKGFFFVKCENKFEKVHYNDILFIEAAGNYVLIHQKHRRLMTFLTMKSLEDHLPSEHFTKVHKSFIVSLEAIDNLSPEEISIRDYRIPVSRNLKDDVMTRIVGKQLLKRK